MSKVTVIIAVFNGANTIENCIESVISQSLKDKELIVIDGGSTDNTINILKRNSNKINYWISEPDSGIYEAFNKGLARANGEWIFFLGSDDYFWQDDVLDLVYEKLVGIDPVITKIVYGKVALVNSLKDCIEILNRPWKDIKKAFLEGCCICHQGVFHHRTLFEQHGFFDETFRISGVYELLLRELKDKDAVFLEDIIVSGMQYGGLSTTSINSIRILQEYRKARSINFVKTFPAMLYWSFIKAFIKEILAKLPPKYCIFVFDSFRKLTGRKPIWRDLLKNG